MIKKIWNFIRRPSGVFSLGTLVIGGFFAGIIFWGGFNTAMEHTNTLEFCISCHEMEDTVYQEYKTSPHFSNASGVQAICSDCHVPKAWFPKVIRKIQASGEIYHKIVGTISTPEKFEARRLHLAEKVWATMEANDSLSCRNCHSEHQMDFAKQSNPKKAKLMKEGLAKGDTCISCHKGIAHHLPDMSQGYKKKFEDLTKASLKEAGKSDDLYTLVGMVYFHDLDAAKDGKKPAGQLLSATHAKVLDRSGDYLKVRIEGWQQDEVQQVIYELRGHRIFTATVKKSAFDLISVEATETDPETDLIWHKVGIDVWVKNENFVANRDLLWDYGADIFSSSCGTCHSKPDPAHLLANQWIGSLKAMKRFTVLDKEQYRLLQKYLQLHAKDTGNAEPHG